MKQINNLKFKNEKDNINYKKLLEFNIWDELCQLK
jgi:hypothetical protein